MKNTKKRIKTILITFLLVSFTIFIGKINTASSNIDYYTKNSQLLSENYTLRNNLRDLQNKIIEIENTIIEVKKIDNDLYSHIMGIPMDTLNVDEYSIDSIDFIIDNFNEITTNLNNRSKRASKLISMQLARFNYEFDVIKKNGNIINYYPTISPIKTKDFIRVSSGFGWRSHPVYKKPLFHEGIDISACVGTKVFASANGSVIKILRSKYGYGNRIVIKHRYGYETLYAHLKYINVKIGQHIKKGQQIGVVGNTGTSTGPHLHYEVLLNGKHVDPLGYFYTYITDDLIADINK